MIVRMLILWCLLLPVSAQDQTPAEWQVRVSNDAVFHRVPNPGCFSLEYLEKHILPLDAKIRWAVEHTPDFTVHTDARKVGTFDGRVVYCMVHHTNDSYYDLVKSVLVEEGEDCFSPVIYMASNHGQYPNVRVPWIVEVAGHQVLTSCDRVSGTGRYYTRYDLIFDGDQIRDIEMSGRFQELADANKPAGAESCRPLLYFDSEGRDCKGVDLETMTYRCIFPKTQTVLEMGVKLEDVTFVPVSVKSMSYRELEDREHP